MCEAVAHPLFVSTLYYLYVPNECVKEEIIRVMSYLCPQRKKDVVKVLPSETACNDRAVSYPPWELGKVCPSPLEGKANFSQEAVEIGTEQKICSKFYNRKIFTIR